ncbi:hypothetical protein CY35_18G070600 [Sphagnum magellanicum]|nr:hypothetical protein CY35_18G070600 [Sphagnum magellanicum]
MPLLGLKERLLEAAGMDSGMMDYCKEHDSKKPSSSNSHGRSRVVHHHNDKKKKKTARSGLTEDEIVRRLQGKAEARESSQGMRRRFLLRLAVALHSYGSSAARTEYLIDKAADRLEVETSIAVFPSLILLSFPSVDENDPTRKEIHLLTVDSNLDVDKLGRADELANHVGSLWDGAFSLLLGFIVGVVDIIASRSSLFASVMEFTAALLVSFMARMFQVHLRAFHLCYFAMALSSLVQLLPGMSLTLGVSEMVAKSHVTGTSRVMYALFSALQLGFGLAMGENLVWWAPKPVSAACVPPDLSIWLNLIWFSGYTFASNVLLNARLDQWPGMALASFVGYVVSELTSLRLDSSASSVISAFAVGITGTAYSQFTGDLPLVMILSGILLLVPGGIGVQGVAAMLQDDVLSGMGFVFDMVVVGLSITLGLLVAKILLPSALLGTSRANANNKNTLPTQLEKDRADGAIASSGSDSDSEEDMAI